jgi:hypothetical protein
MSTSAITLQRGSVQSARGRLVALLAVILLAAAAMVAVNVGQPAAGTPPVSFSDEEIQKSLIDVRAGERVGVGIPTAEFWAQFRADEREMR